MYQQEEGLPNLPFCIDRLKDLVACIPAEGEQVNWKELKERKEVSERVYP